MKEFLPQKETIVIDIKPISRDENSLFLCELTDVYGYSDHNWTPVLFRMKSLYVDKPIRTIDKECFSYPEDGDIIYTMLYLRGTVKKGNLKGTWNFPGPSPTNSVLLWFDQPYSYFLEIIKKDKSFRHKT